MARKITIGEMPEAAMPGTLAEQGQNAIGP
jgi:hypothetical protein